MVPVGDNWCLLQVSSNLAILSVLSWPSTDHGMAWGWCGLSWPAQVGGYLVTLCVDALVEGIMEWNPHPTEATQYMHSDIDFSGRCLLLTIYIVYSIVCEQKNT